MLKANIEGCENGWIVYVYGDKLSDGKRFVAKDYDEITDIFKKHLKKEGKDERHHT